MENRFSMDQLVEANAALKLAGNAMPTAQELVDHAERMFPRPKNDSTVYREDNGEAVEKNPNVEDLWKENRVDSYDEVARKNLRR